MGEPFVKGREWGLVGKEFGARGRETLAFSSASAMEGCCTVAISSDLTFLFPTLLQLSTEGEGFGSSFPRGHFRAVRSQELQLLCCGCGGGGTGVGAAARAPPEGLAGLGGQCGRQDSRVLVLAGGALSPKALGKGSFPSQGTIQGQLFLGTVACVGSGSGEKGSCIPGTGVPCSPPGLSGASWQSALHLVPVSFSSQIGVQTRTPGTVVIFWAVCGHWYLSPWARSLPRGCGA